MPSAQESLRATVLASLEAELARQTHAALDAREESISEESRAENKYDTHAQEAAYLAEGQARLAAELATALAAWRALVFPPPGHTAAQVGSLVGLTAGQHTDFLLLGPTNGGLTLPFPPGHPAARANADFTVITPASPLGRALLGQSVGAPLPPLRKGAPARKITTLG